MKTYREEVIDEGKKFLDGFLNGTTEEKAKIFWLLEGIKIGKQLNEPKTGKE